MLSPSAKVGLMVLITTIALIGVYLFLTQAGLKAQSYPLFITFQDAKGVERGAPVRMAGVRIGQVESVGIGELQSGRTGAVVKVLINRRYTVGSNYTYTIKTVGLLGQPYIEVIPARQVDKVLGPGAKITGKEAVEITDLLPQAQEMLKNINQVALSANRLVSDRVVIERLRSTAANLESASARADQLVSTIQGIAVENRDEINLVLRSATDVARSLQRISLDIEEITANPRTRNDLEQITENTRRATEKLPEIALQLEGITRDVRKVTADPELQRDIKDTVENARATTVEAKALLERLNKALGGLKTPEIKFRFGLDRLVEHPRIDLLAGPREGDLRGDLNFTVPRADGSFWLWGVRNLAESNRINYQLGQPLTGNTRVRYGLWASKLGLGVDYTPFSRYMLETNLYGLNDPRWDIYNRYQFYENNGVILGMEGIGSDNRLVGGVSYEK